MKRPPVEVLVVAIAALSLCGVTAVSAVGASTQNAAAPPAEGDAVRGKLLFQRRCTGCHALDADRDGPKLAGVFGRKAGSVNGFVYSEGLRNAGWTWNDATLEKWLIDPDLMVPDNNMSFRVPDGEERRDLIAFLRQSRSSAPLASNVSSGN